MENVTGLAGKSLLALALCCIGQACTPRYCTDYSEFKRGLIAEIHVPSTTLDLGATYPGRLSLRNAGPVPLVFCRDTGPSIAYHLGGDRFFPLRWDGRTVDASCAEKVHLAPGESLDYPFDVVVPPLGVASADLVTWYTVSGTPECRSGDGTIQVSASIPVAFVEADDDQ